MSVYEGGRLSVEDFVGKSYQRYAPGARYTVPENPQPPYDPGLVEADDGTVYWLRQDGKLFDVAAGGDKKEASGGYATVTTDSNGQATVVFPEPFAKPPDSIITTPMNQLVALGTLELTKTHVMVWAWDLSAGGWATDREINLYWIGLLH